MSCPAAINPALTTVWFYFHVADSRIDFGGEISRVFEKEMC